MMSKVGAANRMHEKRHGGERKKERQKDRKKDRKKERKTGGRFFISSKCFLL